MRRKTKAGWDMNAFDLFLCRYGAGWREMRTAIRFWRNADFSDYYQRELFWATLTLSSPSGNLFDLIAFAPDNIEFCREYIRLG